MKKVVGDCVRPEPGDDLSPRDGGVIAHDRQAVATVASLGEANEHGRKLAHRVGEPRDEELAPRVAGRPIRGFLTIPAGPSKSRSSANWEPAFPERHRRVTHHVAPAQLSLSPEIWIPIHHLRPLGTTPLSCPPSSTPGPNLPDTREGCSGDKI